MNEVMNRWRNEQWDSKIYDARMNEKILELEQ